MGTTTIPEERRYLGKDKLKTVLTKVKEKLAGKVDKVSGKQLSTNDYTTTEKNKLAGIAAGANNYSHPAYTARTGVPTADAKPGFGGTFQVSQPVSDSQGHITAVNTRTVTIPNAAATTSAAGLMSSTDKKKLDGIEAGAQKNTVTGIKGNAESSYRTGNVNLTPADIGAAKTSHTHAISEVTDLQSTLNGKAAASHVHSANDITSGTLPVERIADGSITKEKLAEGVLDNNDILISTIYIDQTITDPASMISGDINGAAIQAIRANSHRYLGKYTAENTMTICQLNDANSNQYADGSAAVLTGAEGDVFMRLPVFYTKATELTTDRWRIDFAFGGQPEGDWKQWGGNDLLGVYKACLIDSKLYSRSGVTPSSNYGINSYKVYARNRGIGFTCIKLKHSNIMAFLFLAIYGITNCQAMCGTGAKTTTATGYTDSLGMTDTTPSNGNSSSVNFWGVENFYGNVFELVDNVVINNRVFSITEDDGSVRTMTACSTDGFISKISIGKYLDLIAKETSGSGTTGYCDTQNQSSEMQRELRRGGWDVYVSSGVFNQYYVNDLNFGYTDTGTRISFSGDIIETTNPSVFKSLTAIG